MGSLPDGSVYDGSQIDPNDPYGFLGYVTGDGSGLDNTGDGYYDPTTGTYVDETVGYFSDTGRRGTIPPGAVWREFIGGYQVYILPIGKDGKHFNVVVQHRGGVHKLHNFHVNFLGEVNDPCLTEMSYQAVDVRSHGSVVRSEVYSGMDPYDSGDTYQFAADTASWMGGQAGIDTLAYRILAGKGDDFEIMLGKLGRRNIPDLLCN